MWVLILLVMAAAVAYAIGYALGQPKPVKPEPKTFGLEEARAARGFIQTPEQAKAVKAVVVGVLNYEDTVAEEADIAAYELKETKDSRIRDIGRHRDEIQALEARIATLRTANEGIDIQSADLAALKSMFA